MIFNPDAIDYSAGVRIVDPLTEKEYTQEEAQQLEEDTRKRLQIKANKIGCNVLTIEESNEIISKRQGELTMEIDESDKDPNYIPDRDEDFNMDPEDEWEDQDESERDDDEDDEL